VNKPCQSKLSVADRFGRREQIGQGTGWRALHPAEIRRAMEADA
jgi:hypothetical protein